MQGRERIAEYLQEHQVEFQPRVHEEAITAQEVAAAEHVPGNRFAKVVIGMADDELVMLVLPAPYEVDFDAVAAVLDADEARLAEESEFESVFDDCELGAMPPFGNLYDVPVVVEEALTQEERIVFNAGTHQESFEVSYADFERLVEPQVANIAYHTA